MDAANILSADVLDIIFDARNKEYGAYDLRKNYRRRLMKAVITMFLAVVLLLVAYLLMATIKPKPKGTVDVKDVELTNVNDKKKVELIQLIQPPKQIDQPKVRTIKDMVPLIVKDDVPTDVPEQKDVDDAKIGNANVDGKADDGIQGPPVDEKTGVVEAPKKQDDDDLPFTRVEIESRYPGGMTAWSAYLNRNLTFPQEAVDAEVQGTVTIQFIVDTDGNVSDVTAISGPQELRAAAIAVIKKSGKWEPAIQNGRKVKSYKKQPITFKFVE